ncbi:hypothetical protein T05_5292 [Trichinella murrelli]|uniref:Uncharacterized protein n=1 Tax=Trichinella murrelli TaxID=144512 RepID=A0A0V0SXV0_9BILA|nr:hypothetical protein T05_5292 [Trichinella murrelli]
MRRARRSEEDLTLTLLCYITLKWDYFENRYG